MKSVLVTAMTTIALSLVTSPVQAAHTHYGESARHMAAEISCKNFTRNGGGTLHRDSGVCWVKGRRVNVITFKGPAQQGEWNTMAKGAFGSGFWWGNGRGALVVAKNGNKPAARIGANRLPGKLVHG